MNGENMLYRELAGRSRAQLCGGSLAIALSSIFGPTGCEDRASNFFYKESAAHCDKVVRDGMGNVICKISLGEPTKRKRVMLCAHTDEVGFMIEEIKSNGMLTFACLGGIDPAVLPGKRVLIGNEKELINGVICSKAIHHKSKKEREVAVGSDELYIDAGFTSKKEASEYISIGDFATFKMPENPTMALGKNDSCLHSKALDDRMGCAIIFEIMREINQRRAEMKLDLDLYFCFTVGEETGHSGAIVTAERIAPDFAIIFESTAVGDLPDTPYLRKVARLGEGAVISIADRATIYDKQLVELAFSVSSERDIPIQVKQYLSGGNDAGHIHKSGIGVRSLAISIPTRYLHSQACLAANSDYDSAKNLGFAMLEKINSL